MLGTLRENTFKFHFHNHLIIKYCFDQIEEITETGIKTSDGVNHEVDAIIYAIGFDLQKSAREKTLVI